MVPHQYAFVGPASGNWCVPLLWIAKILRRLCPLPGSTPYLSEDQFRQFTTFAPYDPAQCPGSEFTYGTFRQREDRSGPTFRWKPPQFQVAPPQRVTRLFHNGRIAGGAALIGHQYPLDPQDDPTDTLSFCVAFNLDFNLGGAGSDGEDIFRILELQEMSGLFPAKDLFDEIP
jgi:hypothetical protein